MAQISVIGRACRLPGANSVNDFWDVLDRGRCTVTHVPEERFAQAWYLNPRKGEAGKAYTFAAGVLDDIWGFDPGVFSITPREARQMDPQQRILLQLVWEALEDAGVGASDVAGKRIGVYVGASSMDYSHRQFFDPAGTDSYLMTGNTLSLISNRVSYIFDLQGPSLTIDTACSSSLVALDYAAQDLKAGRIDTAIVGGVNALLSPFNYMGFCAASMLSPDGLCRPFDHRGNGYVRAEGGVVMLLQRADASDGLPSCRNYGNIVASGMNSDGRTSGVALPSSEQQGALLHGLYERHGIDPNDLAFVEAHGTGTLVGDPAEAGALGRMLGVNRSQPLPIGSAKSNVGHLEPASGIVGLLKAQLALEHGRLPQSLHIERLNPHIDFEALNLKVAADAVELSNETDAPRLAGVNNFGFGGTNVHVVVSAPTIKATPAEEPTGDLVRIETAYRNRPAENLLLVSGHCEDALRELAGHYAAALKGDASESGSDPQGREFIAASAHRRDRLSQRVVAIGSTNGEISAALARYSATGDSAADTIVGQAVARDAKTALVFSGNGSQWDGMGRVAFETSQSFKRHFRAVDGHYEQLTGQSLEDLLFAEDLAELLERTEIAQPLLFALQVALARSLQDQGLVFEAVLGHSVGEVAAAHIAGALDLKQAVSVIRARSKHQELSAGHGLMAAIHASAQDVRSLLDANGLNDVEIAAHNSPRSVTVSGAPDEIHEAAKAAEAAQIPARVLDINYPFHSAKLDMVREPLLETLAGLAPRATDLALFSTVTGERIEGAQLGTTYWWDNVRQPVRFDAAVAACAEAGCQVFVEIGPRSILRKYITDAVATCEADARVVTSLEKGETPARPPIRATLARAISVGAKFDTDTVFGADNGAPVPLPPYAWQNKEYLFAISTEALDTFNTANRPHPLLGLQLRPEDFVWDSHLDTGLIPFLGDHCVGGKPIMPGTGYVEMALSAAAQQLGSQDIELRDLDFVQALELHDDACQAVRTRIDLESSTIEVSSRPRLTDDQRQTHMRTRFGKRPSDELPAVEPFKRIVGNEAPIKGEIYRLAEKFGLDYGPAFQRVTACREIGDDLIEVELSPPPPGDDANFILHPVDFDTCFHGLNAVYERLVFGENKLAYVPVHLGRLRVAAPGRRVRAARIHLKSYNTRAVRAGFELFAEDGTLVAIAENVRFRASSLVHRVNLGQAAYHIDHIVRPLPGRAGESAAPSPSDVITALVSGKDGGFGAPRTGDRFEENQLLLEMAARRAAFDVLDSLVGADRIIDLAPTGMHASACASDNDNREADLARLPRWNLATTDRAAALSNLVSLLASSDLAVTVEGSRRWELVASNATAMPPLDQIVATVLQDDPAWSSECVLLLRAVDHLKDWLGTDPRAAPLLENENSEADEEKSATPAAADVYSSSVLEHFACASPLAAAQIKQVATVIETVRAHWPLGRPLRILQLGIAGGGLTHALATVLGPNAEATAPAHLVVGDTDESATLRLASLYVRQAGLDVVHITGELEELDPFGKFDLVISVNGLNTLQNAGVVLAKLREHVADGALAIISETEPTAFHDVIFGGTRGWFDTALVEGVAHGRLRSGEQWAQALEPAGFVEAVDPVSGNAALPGTGLVVARAQLSSHADDQNFDDGAEHATAVANRQTLILPGDAADAGLVQSLEVALDEAGCAPVSGTIGTANFEELLDNWFNSAPGERDIVFLSPAHGDDQGSSGQRKSAQAVLLAETASLTRLLNLIGDRPARLWIVAEGGARAIAGLGRASPVQSGLWGYGRTALNEFANLDIRLVDFGEPLSLATAAHTLGDLVREGCDLSEVIVTDTALHGLQVRRGPPPETVSQPDKARDSAADDQATVLELVQSGDLESLTWTSAKRCSPNEGDVEVAVEAAGLNFRDVMWSLGLLPEEALEDGFAGPTVGFECSGRVVSVGTGVTDFAPGDRVIAMAPACFASHVTVTQDAIAKLPDSVALTDAASIPVAFLTAYYALDHLARLRRDEWVLIHGAAGGVGLAAVQVAKRAGARIIATAGTDEKRSILTALGADYVLDTRSLEFVDKVRGITGGGVDVLLNSLAGEAMERSIDLMRPFGRFLELGKRDFYANTKVGLRPFRRNVSYFGIDADQLLTYRPDVVRTVFREIMDGFADGTFTPLPHRVFESASVVDAFRLMQKSGHIGKIIVEAPAANAGRQVSKREFVADADGTHVLVGGTGGFGLEMARWLADRGARHILLTSRSGGGSDEIRQLSTTLKARGVSLKVARCDVTDRASLDTLLTAERAKRPLAGIAHTAMVLDDSLIENLTPERIETVLAPKVQGGEALDRLTRNDNLQYFLLFSSAAAMFGNPGQANYTAANGYLDGLAQARSATGRKAISVAWGAISDAGVLTRQKDTAESLARHTGGIEFKARDGLNLLARLLVRDDFGASCTNVTLATMNWSMAADMLAIMNTPAYALIRREAATAGETGDQVDIRAAIEGLDDVAAQGVLADFLAREVAQIFRMAVDDISHKRSLADMGMDSLMGLELRMAAQRGLGIDIPIVSISDGTTINDIAGRVLTRLRGDGNDLNGGPGAERGALLAKHVSEDVDESALEELERRVEAREAGLRKVV